MTGDPKVSDMIVERIFRSIYPRAVLEVSYDRDEEQWIVKLDDGKDPFICQVGSDDDDFRFTRDIPMQGRDGIVMIPEHVRFPFPTDWEA